jgi:hypothetical protein
MGTPDAQRTWADSFPSSLRSREARSARGARSARPLGARPARSRGDRRSRVHPRAAASAPSHGRRAARRDWKGTVEPTVDDTKHVNGGCRSLQSDGRHWRCYLGEEAVRQRIIGAGFLGEYAPSPGVG